MKRVFAILATGGLITLTPMSLSVDKALAQSVDSNGAFSGLYVGNNSNANIFQTTNPPGNHMMWVDGSAGANGSSMVILNNGKAQIYHYDPNSANHYILVNP